MPHQIASASKWLVPVPVPLPMSQPLYRQYYNYNNSSTTSTRVDVYVRVHFNWSLLVHSLDRIISKINTRASMLNDFADDRHRRRRRRVRCLYKCSICCWVHLKSYYLPYVCNVCALQSANEIHCNVKLVNIQRTMKILYWPAIVQSVCMNINYTLNYTQSQLLSTWCAMCIALSLFLWPEKHFIFQIRFTFGGLVGVRCPCVTFHCLAFSQIRRHCCMENF